MRKATTIILIHGVMQSGKDTLGSMIQAELFRTRTGLPVNIIKFADALKNDCRDHIQPILNIINERIDEVISRVHPSEMSFYHRLMALKTNPDNWYENKTELTRLFLQKIGTEFCRATDSDVWAKRFAKAVRELDITQTNIVICTDLRFENEASIEEQFSIEERQFIEVVRIKVVRNSAQSTGVIGHASEAGLDDDWFDYIVENNYDLTTLMESAKLIIDHLTQDVDTVDPSIECDEWPLHLPLNFTRNLPPPK